MSKTTKRGPATRTAGAADDYLDLVRRFPVRPLRTAADFREAAAVLDRLAVCTEGTLTPGEQDYLDALTLIVEAYDAAHCPDLGPPPSPREMLRALMENAGMTVTELGGLLGSKGCASEVLSGKRSISKAHMFKLAGRFGVDPGVFLERPA